MFLELGHRRDVVWERDLRDRLRHGGRAPHTLSIYEFIQDPGTWIEGGSWAFAERHSRNAIRNNSTFLNDQAIAARSVDIDARREAYKEWQAAEKARKAKAREEAEREQAERRAREEEARRLRKEGQKVWAQRQAERRARVDAFQEHRSKIQERERQRELAEVEWELAAAEKNIAERRRRIESDMILQRKWECSDCGKQALIFPMDNGYRLRCFECGKTAWAEHERFAALVVP